MKINGTPASPGIAISKVYKLEKTSHKIPKDANDISHEISLFDESIKYVSKNLKQLAKKTKKNIGADEALVFEAHIQIVEDPVFLEETKTKIKSLKYTAAYSINEVLTDYIETFSNMDDEYMKQRAIDIEDIRNQLLNKLIDSCNNNKFYEKSNIVIFAKEITPSDSVLLDKNKVRGIITEEGGSTSHAIIISRTLGIPSIIGVGNILQKVKNNDDIIIDGTKGIAIVNPTHKELEIYKKSLQVFEAEKKNLQKYVNRPTMTSDGIKINIEANIGNYKDAVLAYENGASGIGLFRTEFLYMEEKNWPSEQKLFSAFKKVLSLNSSKPVIVRTLDIGGDKNLPYFNFSHENNPFLGQRSIRFSLSKRKIFKTQLRALIRASFYGKLMIMFPMVSTIAEFNEAKKVYDDCYNELAEKKAKIASKKDIKIGMMIEVPSSGILVDQFANITDFFSIGSNDLIQYTMATDRTSESVRYLYQPANISVLRLIALTIKAADLKNIPVAVCGESASNKDVVPLLVGLGLKSFSVSPGRILALRKQISTISFKEEHKKIIEKIDISSFSNLLNKIK